jgi:hypothetical protein
LPSASTSHNKPRAFPSIPVLPDYSKIPSEAFWKDFPFNPLPVQPETKISIEKLKDLIEKSKHLLLKTELDRANKCVEYLTSGAPSFQSAHLPGCSVKNSDIALRHGHSVTDTIASWVEKKFVAGPFPTPPVPGFRANSILAVPQASKTRICINVSLPKDKSFNDNIRKSDLEKVKMSSARLFGYSIVEAGKNCSIAKHDIVDAYKNVPAKIDDLRLQGFTWLGKHFIELRQMFGAASSVQNFDILANTVKTLALTSCRIPSKFVHRQLDDVPVVAPAHTDWADKFYKEYKKICDSINLELAKASPDLDKAFGCSKKGKILGIWFNTSDLTWSLPEDKRAKTVEEIETSRNQQICSLKQMQTLMGRLNFVSSMCPFMNIFKWNLNNALSEAIANGSVSLGRDAKNDLLVWWNFLNHQERWVPIPREVTAPPLASVNFWSDAAGFPDNAVWTSEIGCGVVGTTTDGDTILGYQLWWNKHFITEAKDKNGKRFGNKTSTLEMIALLLPILTIPDQLRNCHICIFTDNMSCVFGMKDGYVKNDETSSIFVRTAHLIGAFLGSVIHVEHCPRRSSWEAEVADNLTRKSTTSFLDEQIIRRYSHHTIPAVLNDWMASPSNNWDLPLELLKHVMNSQK